MFESLDTRYILSQVMGIIALVIIVIGYFSKDKQKFFLTQFIGNIFISISFLFLGTYFACIGVLIACIRSGTFFAYEKKGKETPIVLVVLFCALTIANVAIFWKDAWDLLPLASLLGYTIGFRIKNMQTMRIVFLICCLCFLTFTLVKYAYSNALLKIFEIITLSIALFKFNHSANPTKE